MFMLYHFPHSKILIEKSLILCRPTQPTFRSPGMVALLEFYQDLSVGKQS